MAKRKVLLADVLWRAANEKLAIAPTDFNAPSLEFSCNAVLAAEAPKMDVREAIYKYHTGRRRSRALEFLRTLGCDPSASMPWPVHRFGSVQVQGVRYMWLLLAMHVAEDEGIEIEVSA